LPDACARPVLVWIFLPFLISRLLSKMGLVNEAYRFLNWWTNLAVSWVMEPCDVVIAMSGIFYWSITKAKRKWDSKILVERGSRHILSQKKILDELKTLNRNAKTVSESDVRHELKDYEVADRIVVPSKHVAQSFVEYGIPEIRLFRNPYGVDLSMFGTTESPKVRPTLLIVGTWCYRKGCDLLVEALEGTSYQLLHAGSIGDCSFPNNENFKSFGFVDQSKLKPIYAQAHVFILPSREDGFGLVLAQALACGLPVVCSDRTGGEDLREMMSDKNRVTVVKSNDVIALKEGIAKAMNYALDHPGLREISSSDREQMSWKAYGERYHRFLIGLMNETTG
jgi:glycosyltransferase involved in cell wall biosynthesis